MRILTWTAPSYSMSNTFRDGQYAKKTLLVLEALTANEKQRLSEVQDKMHRNGALYDADVKTILGAELYRRLISVGFFDRMEVSNSTEAVGYIASPNVFRNMAGRSKTIRSTMQRRCWPRNPRPNPQQLHPQASPCRTPCSAP